MSVKTQENLKVLLLDKIQECEVLIATCKNLPDILGKNKLIKRIQAEQKFLKRLSNQHLKEDHLRSSNLCSLSSIIKCCSKVSGVTKILEPAIFNPATEPKAPKRIAIDVIADNGHTWIKVVARNPRAVLLLTLGDGKFGQKSIVDQMAEMVECAKQNEYMFSVPEVQIWFACSIDTELKKILETINVKVNFLNIIGRDKQNIGSSLDCDKQCSEVSSSSEILQSPEQDIKNENVYEKCDSNVLPLQCFMNCDASLSSVLNLDVSTMIAYVSNLTNGGCNSRFNENILSEQARSERVMPVKPILENLFKGHTLICCQSAYTDFINITSCVGGMSENQRASELLSVVTVVPDTPSINSKLLPESSRIKKRSKIIFGTGDHHKAITVTANVGFVRAAIGKGVKFAAFVHESRALTELKEVKSEN